MSPEMERIRSFLKKHNFFNCSFEVENKDGKFFVIVKTAGKNSTKIKIDEYETEKQAIKQRAWFEDFQYFTLSELIDMAHQIRGN